MNTIIETCIVLIFPFNIYCRINCYLRPQKRTKIDITPYNTYIIVADMKGNIRVYRIPEGRSTDNCK